MKLCNLNGYTVSAAYLAIYQCFISYNREKSVENKLFDFIFSN